MKINNQLVGMYENSTHNKNALIHEHEFAKVITKEPNKFLLSCVSCGIYYCEQCGYMLRTSSPTLYRDRVYIIQDIILKLAEYGELNQTALISFTGLNLKKHRCILDELEANGLIQKSESPFGKRVVIVYKPTQKGIDFCRSILEPYERMFPRKKESVLTVNNNSISNSNKTVKPSIIYKAVS
jgi:predicted transcriptional regulator